ncbi:flagellar hook-associated protein 2 [Agarivorans sp. Toyoura001]|uniref:flagellar filament capping protein FliD n=1 Tax=Agarivorans sp. Toyoura001 TaxID=2283141 RepID=UPI0010D139BE|nr:flagellar filament capping protein FliD [Agarivorans sp. Toyoura001]GDY27934.1 flagellar hook-associated protein 2 [Agarivorans sp. Toyoura001]
MTGITAAGIGSGLDLEALIEVSINAERAGKDARFETTKNTLDVSLSAVGSVKSALSSFLSILEKAQEPSTFIPRVASTGESEGNESVTVDLADDATNGNYAIEVQQLAQGSSLTSIDATANGGTPLYSSDNDVVATTDGQLTFATASGESMVLDVAAGTTLKQLREQINDHDDNFGISVNLIDTGTEIRLAMTSEETGDGNTLTVTNTGANAELDNFTNAGGKMAVVDASSAIITIDGIQATSETNKFDNVVSGMTITANKVTSSAVSLNIAPSEEKALENMKEFVDAYNKVISEIDKYSKPETVIQGEDGESNRKELSGDAMFRSLRFSLGSIASNGYDNAAPGFKTLYGIGVEVDNDGMLQLDETKFKANLANDMDGIGEVFAMSGGIAESFSGIVSSYEKSDGILASREESINSQLRDYEHDKLDFEERMASYEKTLRAKYTAFDVAMGNLNSQMSYITGQLAQLNS